MADDWLSGLRCWLADICDDDGEMMKISVKGWRAYVISFVILSVLIGTIVKGLDIFFSGEYVFGLIVFAIPLYFLISCCSFEVTDKP